MENCSFDAPRMGTTKVVSAYQPTVVAEEHCN